MPSAPMPPDEPARLQALRECAVLDTPAEERFDEITKMVTLVTGCTSSVVSLVDADRQWFKSRVNTTPTETPRCVALCGHTILSRDPLIIEDTSLDPRVSDSPLVSGAGGIRFYAGFPIVLESGHVVGALCAVDAAPRTLDAAQIALMRLLARQVATLLDLRRTVKRLDAALDDAQQAARTKQRFLANASHELRTPLSVVSMSAEAIIEACPSTLGSIAESLRTGLTELNDIVARLLDLAAAERNQIMLAPVRCSIAGEVREVVRLFSAKAAARSVGLVAALDPSLPEFIEVDVQHLRQALSSLVSNAVKFTHAGRVRVLASWNDGRLTLLVEDTGIGMDAASIERLFTPSKSAMTPKHAHTAASASASPSPGASPDRWAATSPATAAWAQAPA